MQDPRYKHEYLDISPKSRKNQVFKSDESDKHKSMRTYVDTRAQLQ